MDGDMGAMDMSLSKLQELVMGRETWCATDYEVTKSRTPLSDFPFPFPIGSAGKEPTWQCRTEKAMAPRSSTLAWKIPWMEEPGRLQSMGSLRVGHD